MNLIGRLRRLEAELQAEAGFVSEGVDVCRAAIRHIELLEAGPRHKECVHPPVSGWPHESDCTGCRIEKLCTQCGHFVDMLSKHR